MWNPVTFIASFFHIYSQIHVRTWYVFVGILLYGRGFTPNKDTKLALQKGQKVPERGFLSPSFCT